MRRNPRSENRKIVRKFCDTGEAATAAEIASRVFPFRSPPASMPSVGARRSTRVFVPKATTAKPRDGDTGALPPAKRLTLPKDRPHGDVDEWMSPWWKPEEGEKGGLGAGVLECDEPVAAPEPDSGIPLFDMVYSRKPVTQEPKDTLDGKMFDRVYSRKRQRPRPSDSVSSSFSKDRRYGAIYARRKQQSVPEESPREAGMKGWEHKDAATRLEITEYARNFAKKVAGISEGNLCTASDGPMVLAVLVESSCSRVLQRFSRILISILIRMKRSRAGLREFAAILFSESLAGVFSLHGIHFLPIQQLKIDALSRNAVSGCGLCKIYGAGKFVPLLSIDFCVLPIYFKTLHVAMVLGSQYLPGVLARYLMDCMRMRYEEECDSLVPAETSFSVTSVTGSVIPAVESNNSPSIAEAPEPVAQNPVIMHGSRLQKHQKKRCKMKPQVDHNGVILSLLVSSSSLSNLVEPVRVKPLDARLGDLFSIREEDDVSSPCGLHSKNKKFEGTKVMKLALAEVKQNIDSVRCNVNILVTDSDRCWREEGAEVMLEFSDSKEWCIAVRARGAIQYLHKPQDWRPCVVNRFTHTYMWAGEDGWKLEFFDKWDWSVFKELHMECRERNMPDVPVKIIPVPGVREVSGYEETAMPSFVRPNKYIHIMGDEVERALASEIASYDMDSGDEEWLKQLNSSSLDLDDNGLKLISVDDFEKIIFALEKDAYKKIICPLEKDAYNNLIDIPDKERAVDLCQDLVRRDIVAAVYDYWLKKRNKRRLTLVKMFQGLPLRRTPLIQKPYLRKKRSFSRQRSMGGRSKPGFFLQAGAKQQEAIRRVQEAESAANIAVESAIRLRSRAQMFMANAELAACKSVMALRIAEAKHVSESSDLASSIID